MMSSMESIMNAPNDKAVDDLCQRGLAAYERLKAQLEPANNNQFDAIHIDSGD